MLHVFNEYSRFYHPLFSFEGSTAYWFCVGLSGTFENIEPDRSECKHTWVEDVADKVISKPIIKIPAF